MKLSICAETLYRAEQRIEKRLAAIERHGIKSYELWTLSAYDRAELQQSVDANAFQLLLYCGNVNHSLINPDDRIGFIEELTASIREAKRLKCPSLAVLTNCVDTNAIPIPPPRPISDIERLASVYEGLRRALELAEQEDIQLLIEPLNTKVDHPGYFIEHTEQAFELVRSLGSQRLKLIYDIYHMQIMEGNIIGTLESNLDLIGHIHVADVPGRHEPGTGEINYSNIAKALKHCGYTGFVGLECFPADDSDKAVRAFCDIFQS